MIETQQFIKDITIRFTKYGKFQNKTFDATNLQIFIKSNIDYLSGPNCASSNQPDLNLQTGAID